MVSAWEENVFVPVPEEARRAGRRTRPLDVMAAVEPARGVAQAPWSAGGRSPRGARWGENLTPLRRGVALPALGARRPAAPD